MGKNKQLIINIMTMLFTLVINILINFFLSNYLVDKIGESAYGFVSLANNLVSYATIFTTALNSMASRFITISIHKDDMESANKYFSSVLISNGIIVAALVIPAFILVFFLQYIVNVPAELLVDVKILFSLIFINFFINLIGGIFSIATYCKNKLYLSSLRNMESTILKVLVIVGLFVAFKPAVFYIGIATLLSSIYIVLWNVRYTKKLLPEVKVSKKNFSWAKIKELLSSGLWNTITNIGNVLTDGLDLIISNIAISPEMMGVVAIAKIPSASFNTILSNIMTVFQPQILECYAKEQKEETKNEVIKSMKICGIFGNIPFAYILVFGSIFCSLWMPNIENRLLSSLCAITFINIFVGGLISPLYNVFTVTNRVKLNSILSLSSSLLSTLLVLVLVKFTDLGVYAIVGISAIVGLVKGFVIVPIYAAKSLGEKSNIFFSTILKYIVATVVMLILNFLLAKLVTFDSWLMLILSVFICGVIGLIVNVIFLLSKDEIKYFLDLVKSKLQRKGEAR